MKRLTNNKDYHKALTRFEQIFEAKEGTPEGEEGFILGLLIGAYEADNFPIDDPDPIEYIDARLDALGLKRQDLDGVIAKGSSHVSEVMNRKRALSLDAIRALEDRFNMDPKILIQRYHVEASEGSPFRKATSGARAKIVSEVGSLRVPFASSKKVTAKSRKTGSSKRTGENLKVTKGSFKKE